MTTRGLGVDEFRQVAKLIDRVLRDPEDESEIENVRNEVEELCNHFPLYDFVTA
jgi:glycine hydroxymethyltransferase